MSYKRGVEVACAKAEVAERQLYLDEEETYVEFEKYLEANPSLKKAYMDYEEAANALAVIELHYNYLQGLRDGIALTHVVWGWLGNTLVAWAELVIEHQFETCQRWYICK